MRERVGASARGKNRSKVVVGQTYGFVNVLKRVANDGANAVYLCRCECGNVYNVKGARLSGSLVCGSRKHLEKLHEQNKKAPGEAACRAAYASTKNTCAKRRGLSWEVTYEDWKKLTQLPCHYCGSPPSNCAHNSTRNGSYTYSGLDRVDNSVGYVLTNIVPCCKRCNQAKSDQSALEFLDWISKVYQHSVNKI